MVQLAPAATLVPQLLPKVNEDALGPVNVMLLMASGAALVLVSVTLCDALVVPTTWPLKARFGADSVGAVTIPVPLSPML